MVDEKDWYLYISLEFLLYFCAALYWRLAVGAAVGNDLLIFNHVCVFFTLVFSFVIVQVFVFLFVLALHIISLYL